jgi:putative intracellular protease/amidase
MSTRSRSITTAILAALCATAGSLQAQRAAPAATARTNAVVLIVSGAGRDSGRTRPGFEMDELSQAWHIFTSNGFAVTIASPQGGPVQSDRFDRTSGYNAAFLADSSAMRALNNTTPTAGLRADRYDAMFVVGGKGAMFDLPADTALARLAGAMYDRGAVVSAVCHGPAGLVRARTRDGRSLLAGRAVTGFSNEEERVFGKKWAPQFTFMLEDEIRGLGARWEEAALMLPHVAVSERLITGQNPYSTAATSEAVVRALGKAPIARTPWQDERSVNFAAMALTGDALTTRRELARTYKELSVDLIGLLGYYQLQTASDETAVRRALTLMELAAPYMPQTELTLGLAEAYHRLGRTSDARQLVRSVLAANPDQPAAKALLDKLGT